MSTPVVLVLPHGMKQALFAHLFPGDGDEHGAVIAAGVANSPRGIRLLGRDLFLAEDGKDYLPGERGYRMLAGSFVTEKIVYCRNERLCYLAVHNHGGHDRVQFSGEDLASHRRGYPALLDIARAQPVGALVFAQDAVAGELWISKTQQLPLAEAKIIGPQLNHLYPYPQPLPPTASDMFDRQARLFGDAGQHVLSRTKVGLVGAGGAGSLLAELLARLGVGHIIVADPDRLDLTNLPRVVGSTRFDARAFLTSPGRPGWLRAWGKRIAKPKVAIARRVAKVANPRVLLEPIFGDFTDERVARRFVGCDYLFLAADSFQARLVFNAIVHQYLIPGVQVGAKVPVQKESGRVIDTYAVSRPVTPDAGCLWCNGLIPSSRLQDEAASPAERLAQRYVDDEGVEAPSVITLNAIAASQAANDFLFWLTGLTQSDATGDYLRMMPQTRQIWYDGPRRDPTCTECGATSSSRRARGDSMPLPTRE